VTLILACIALNDECLKALCNFDTLIITNKSVKIKSSQKQKLTLVKYKRDLYKAR